LAADIERPVAPEDALDWAEFIAIELPGSYWPVPHQALRMELFEQGASEVQALVDVPTPCGFGGCQACAIQQRKGWVLACQKGLVRDIEDIRE
jgi:hypothetical protein